MEKYIIQQHNLELKTENNEYDFKTFIYTNHYCKTEISFHKIEMSLASSAIY